MLSSDKDITWDPRVERKYIALYRRTHPNEILLVGADNALTRFEQAVDVQPETELMIIAKERSAAMENPKAAEKIRRRLMGTAWDPAYFQKK